MLTDDDLVWVRCELRSLDPALGLRKVGDRALIPRATAERFGRYVTLVDGPARKVGIWTDDG